LWNSPAAAQDEDAPRRTRVGLGAQLVPAYPGADSHNVLPLFDLALARGDEPFEFTAPDESFSFALVRESGFAFGPALSFQGSRKAEDVGARLDKVDATIEAGAFVQYALSPAFRTRVEARRGIGGHEGWTGMAGADYVARDGDKYLFSVGPRVTWSNARYQRAYFGVTPAEAARTGLAAYRPGSGVQGVGAAASFLTQLSRRWGIYSYAGYERLVGDAARSPVVRRLGSRDQASGGIALTYTFGND
jgi:outer membrane protein